MYRYQFEVALDRKPGGPCDGNRRVIGPIVTHQDQIHAASLPRGSLWSTPNGGHSSDDGSGQESRVRGLRQRLDSAPRTPAGPVRRHVGYGRLVAFFLPWAFIGVVAAVVMGRRGHAVYPWTVLGVVLGPLVIPLTVSAVRREQSAIEADAHPYRAAKPGARGVGRGRRL